MKLIAQEIEDEIEEAANSGDAIPDRRLGADVRLRPSGGRAAACARR